MIRSLGGAAVAVVLVLGVVGLSHVPYVAETADHAVLRLAWRVRGVRVDECRPVTAEERARTPAHMRRDEICEGRVLPYQLTVAIDETIVLADTIRPAGARADRPLYVNWELPLPHGVHDVRVDFLRETPADPAAVIQGGTPAALRFHDRLSLRAGEIALLTYDPDRQALDLRGGGRP